MLLESQGRLVVGDGLGSQEPGILATSRGLVVSQLVVGDTRLRTARGRVLKEERCGSFVVGESACRQQGSRGWRLGRGVDSHL